MARSIIFKPILWAMAVLTAAVMAGCGGGGDAAPASSPLPVISNVCNSSPACVDLRTAGNYVILAQSGISNTAIAAAVTGNVGIAPASASAITGFDPLVMDPSNTFSTSTQVSGRIYANDYQPPTPGNLVVAAADAEAAYTDASSRMPDFTDPTSGDISGTTPIGPGVYKWNSAVAISSSVTLQGGATDVWIFQIDGDLNQASGTVVALAGGALAKNVFWQVNGIVTIESGAHFEGVVLAFNDIHLQAGATLNGRLFTGVSVALEGNNVAQP